MNHLNFIFIITSILLSTSACKPRDSELSADDATIAAKNYTYDDITYYYALREPWLLRFKCLPSQVPPNCAIWERANWLHLIRQIPSLKDYVVYEKRRRSFVEQKKVLEAIESRLKTSKNESTTQRLFSQKITAQNAINSFTPDKSYEHAFEIVEQLRADELPLKASEKNLPSNDAHLLSLHTNYKPTEMIVAGQTHTCAIDAKGTPICWGSDPDADASDEHHRYKYAKPLVAMSASRDYTCAVDALGKSFCWGKFFEKPDDVKKRYENEGLFTTAIATAPGFSCEINSLSEPYCWGDPENGLFEDYKNKTYAKPLLSVSANRRYGCVLDNLGAPVCWGEVYKGRTLDTQGSDSYTKPFIKLSAGATHICAIDYLGTPVCNGNDEQKQSSGHKTQTYKKPLLAMSAGGSHTCAIDATGQVFCWGLMNPGSEGYQKDDATNVKPILAIASGWSHACVVNTNGKVRCWGDHEISTGRDPDGYKFGLNVPEDVDLSLAAHGYVK